MNPFRHDTNNAQLNPPPGFNESQAMEWAREGKPLEEAPFCQALYITRIMLDAYPASVSFWKPTPEELAHLNANGAVALTVYGVQHPMVWVGTSVDWQEVTNMDAPREKYVPEGLRGKVLLRAIVALAFAACAAYVASRAPVMGLNADGTFKSGADCVNTPRPYHVIT